jgi:hypothetical protein
MDLLASDLDAYQEYYRSCEKAGHAPLSLAEYLAPYQGGDATSRTLTVHHARLESAPPKAPGGALKPEMNGVETEFAQHLDRLKRSGTVRDWWFEGIKLRVGRVGKRCWWSPDFLVEQLDGRLVLYDTKGMRGGKVFAEDDAIVKARAVAEKYPFPVFFVWKEKNGEWLSRSM